MSNTTEFDNDWEQVNATPASHFRTATFREVLSRASSWDLGDAQYIIRAQHTDGTIEEFAFANQPVFRSKAMELESMGAFLTVMNPETMYYSNCGD